MEGRRVKFGLYLLYLAIVSIYLEQLVMLLAFVILADYQFSNLGAIAGNIYQLTVVLYLIIAIEGMVISFRRLKEKEDQISELNLKLEKDQLSEIVIRSNRKNVPIRLDDILFIESLSDYIKIQTSTESILSKEKISAVSNRLPEAFIRVHRSFIVNRVKVKEFNKEQVYVGENEIPIGRKYRKEAEEALVSTSH